jgi:hypothetical protein
LVENSCQNLDRHPYQPVDHRRESVDSSTVKLVKPDRGEQRPEENSLTSQPFDSRRESVESSTVKLVKPDRGEPRPRENPLTSDSSGGGSSVDDS